MSDDKQLSLADIDRLRAAIDKAGYSPILTDEQGNRVVSPSMRRLFQRDPDQENPMTARAIYDNPDTGQRECYVDGTCQWYVTAHAVMMGNLPGEALALGAFSPGRVSGDPASLPKHLTKPRTLAK